MDFRSKWTIAAESASYVGTVPADREKLNAHRPFRVCYGEQTGFLRQATLPFFY